MGFFPIIYNKFMTSKCRKRLIHKLSDGTKLHKKISKKLLDKIIFTNLEEMANMTNTTTSSASRFVYNLGYSSFKLFLHEYNRKTKDDIIQEFIHKQIKKMQNNIGKEIHIISSKHDKSIAIFLKLRLYMYNFKNSMYDEEIDLEKYLKNISGGTLLLFDIQGDSILISKTISKIATIKKRKFNVVIFSTNS